ncbi:hypothetical protein PAXRUDRAFT_724419 [Paxillus rubicundulus Ve08.2h10]|uniref:Uncharacterized protein n=1 Tax=Paxillus rubicundulus Ve08.2h10 TaxID=930991 RepID=A0A0D0DKH3_9AGAM|nr:hypothetical protein PAXRUDRAFT_724419 [Paxillus rubicundulus Ve08.2h10]
MLSTGLRRILHFGCSAQPHRTVVTVLRQFTVHSSQPDAQASQQPCGTKISSVEEAARKIHRAQVNNLLMGADRFLNTQSPDALKAYLIGKLSDAKFYNTYRSVAFTRSIRFCLERHLFDVAIALHDRMLQEGFVAVNTLRLRLTALKIVKHSTKFMEIVAPLKEVFEDQAYDISAFMDLVHYLINDKSAAATLIDDLAQAFVSMRGIKLSDCPDLVGELASINMRADRWDAAQNWLQVFEQICGTEGIQPDTTPYSDIINTLNDIDPKNGEAIQGVLLRMKSAGVPPDTVVFNTLIRVNLAQQRYKEAFALYRIFMQKRSEQVMPNDVTFKMLFRVAQLTSNQRVSVTRRHRRPDNAVPPRRLFREMLESHLQQTEGQALGRSVVLSVSAFHIALRTFMALEDYAAAFVIIRALHAFGFQPNLQTYLIVLISLLQRMRRELAHPRREGGCCLSDFLMRLRPDEDPELLTICERIRDYRVVAEHTGSSSIGVETITHLLNLGDDRRLTEDDLFDGISPSSRPSSVQTRTRRQHNQVPTIGMLTGTDAPPSHKLVFFSPTPLARILQKALLGELFRKSSHRGVEWDWKSAAGPILKEAKEEMVPADLSRESTEMRKKVEKREGLLPFAASRMRRRRQSARGGREISFDF